MHTDEAFWNRHPGPGSWQDRAVKRAHVLHGSVLPRMRPAIGWTPREAGGPGCLERVKRDHLDYPCASVCICGSYFLRFSEYQWVGFP